MVPVRPGDATMTDGVESGAKAGRKIGVFGGTFDPPHIGHLVAAVDAKEALGLDVVLMVVADVPWQKVDSRRVTPSHHRLAMTVAAVGDREGIEASDIEIGRGGPTYTVDTLAELLVADATAELFVILGRDAAGGFTSWERYREVAEMASLVVVDRPGPPLELDRRFDWTRVDTPEIDVSSSDLRRRVADGHSIDYLTPAAVVDYIVEAGLYRDTPGLYR